MRFLIDNNLSPRMALGLNQAGHDALQVRDWGLADADDIDIFVAAASDKRVVVAQDTDFGTILALRRETKPSVLLFRRRRKSVEALLSVMLANLPQVQQDLEVGAIVVIEDARVRVRRLPIEE